MKQKQNKNFKSVRGWAASLADPFGAPASHIPDFETNASGVITSRLKFTHAPSALSTSTTTHVGGFVVYPGLHSHAVELVETSGGAGYIQDLGDTAGTSGLSNYHDIPNISGFGNAVKLRMTSCGVKVTYSGTELSRGGEYFTGYLQTEYPASTVATTGTQLSPLSTLMGTSTTAKWTVASLKANLKEYKVNRIGDETETFYWKPNGVPPYFRIATAGSYNASATTTGGTTVVNSLFAATTNSGGLPYGSNCLVILITGDTTASASLVGNYYDVEVISHWEAIPTNLDGVVYDLSPSLSDPKALSDAMNVCSASGDATLPSRGRPPLQTFQKAPKQIKSNKTKVYEFIESNREPILKVGTEVVRAAARAVARKSAVRTPANMRIEL